MYKEETFVKNIVLRWLKLFLGAFAIVIVLFSCRKDFRENFKNNDQGALLQTQNMKLKSMVIVQADTPKWPAPCIYETYNPYYPLPNIRLAISNPFTDYNGPSPISYGGNPTPYINIQYRTMGNLHNATSDWYNYNPKISFSKYTYTDTLISWHPGLHCWEKDYNAKAFPYGNFQIRARLIFSNGLCTEWSEENCSGVIYNNYHGFHGPAEGSNDDDFVEANFSVNLNVTLSLSNWQKVNHCTISALGSTSTLSSAGGIHRAYVKKRVRYNQPDSYDYAATVTVYDFFNNSLGSGKMNASFPIYISKEDGTPQTSYHINTSIYITDPDLNMWP